MSTPLIEQFGKYVLLEKLATGGMAEVFLARGSGASGIGKFFAIKRILPQYADSPEFIEMFKDEAKIAINLNHSNIVSIHEFGVEKGQFFLVMDYVEGRNLRQIMNKIKKANLQFSLDQIVYMTKEVAAGLDHAHRCIDGSTGKPLNITHRDMSPQNLMVSFEGETKVVDFGIAKAESQIETTRAGTLKGKFGYMSPEQAEGQAVDLRTDIFSLGIVLWEMLANDRLFVANNEINTLRKIRDCQIPSLRKINPNIQPELERIVQKALARDRNLRYQTAAALHRDLNRFLNRQYPDFSPQDFAVFIKSAFADEILSLRKRLVEYTKVNANNANSSAHNLDDEHTALMSTNTNSLVITHGEGSNSLRLEEPGGFNHGTSGDGAPRNINLSEATKTDPYHGGPKAPASPVLDEAAIEAEMQREISVKTRVRPLEAEESVTSPSISKIVTVPTPRAFSPPPRVMTRPVPEKPKRKPLRMATFMVFIILCVSVYSYLVKYFTPMMAPVIAVTDPYLRSLHDGLGMHRAPDDPGIKTTPGETTASSNSPGGPAPTIGTQPNPPAPSPDLIKEPAPVDPASLMTYMMITSTPSGAEISVNGKSTGYSTPARLEVPTTAVTITLRKRGYQEITQPGVKAVEINHRFVADLQKANIAFIDVELPRHDLPNVVLTINGKEVKPPYKELAIVPNTPTKVRAENRVSGASEEITVNLPTDKRQTINFTLKKYSRLPSGR